MHRLLIHQYIGYFPLHFNIRMKKTTVLLLVLSVTFTTAQAQKISKENIKQLKQAESSIQKYADEMIDGHEWEDRITADSFFIRGFVQALKTNNSFYYAFDSLLTISKLYAPDTSFRIFTWQVMRDFTFYRQRGAIQMRTADGSLKLFPLFDFSDFTSKPNDSTRDNSHWIGAIYYKVLLNTFNEKKYYTLLGYDDNNARTKKKWIEVLTFNNEGKPQFGGRYFQYQNDSIKPAQPAFRFDIEYKKEAVARLNYDEEQQLIVFDHLISESNEQINKHTLVPDGSYEAFRWGNGKWVHVPKLQNLSLGNGNAPIEAAIYDENGNINQKKLNEQSKKNQQLQPKANPVRLPEKKKVERPDNENP